MKFLFLSLCFILSCIAPAQRVITLEQALEEAEKNSPTMREARLSLEQNHQNLVAQRAALKSKFALNLTPIAYSQGRRFSSDIGEWITTENTSAGGSFSVIQPVAVTDGTVTLQNNFSWQDSYSSFGNSNQFKGFSNNASLRIDQPIFTYNRTKMTVRQLELALENSQIYYATRLLSVEQQVTQAFYTVHQAQMDVEIGNEEYKNRKLSYDIIQNKVEAGLSAKEEAFQAELDLLTSESGLYDKRVNLENQLDNFKQFLGLPLDEDLVALAAINVDTVQVQLQQAIERGLSSRMELRQREIEIEEGLFNITQTKAMNEFKGNIAVNVGLFGEDEKFPSVYDRPVNNQDIAVSLTVPIFDWGENKARRRAAQAAQEIREYNFEDEKVNIALSIRQVVRNLIKLQNQIVIARKNEENATLTYNINLEKYKNGDLTSMDLNLVQNQLTQQKLNLTNALIHYKLELLNLKIQTLYDYEQGAPVVPNLGNQ
ncbi:MAG: TolC family protein [Cytophagaceae bacterium]|jgi:outer membrane protein TolC|nr:TolC family protein [Cytophagaceae bacterium]